MEVTSNKPIGLAYSLLTESPPKYQAPKSLPSKSRYIPCLFECVQALPSLVYRWRIKTPRYDCFYFSKEEAARCAIGLAVSDKVSFVLGIKRGARVSASEMAFLGFIPPGTDAEV